MKTLFINSSTPQTSIALFEGSEVMSEKQWPSEHNESQTLMPAVEEMLKALKMSPDDVDRLLICVGPGGFTSCRIGVSAGNAWSFAKEVPIASCSVFDLYDQSQGQPVLIAANPSEAWLKSAGEDPVFIHVDELPDLSGQVLTGFRNDTWAKVLNEHEISWEDQEQGLPQADEMSYGQEPVMPWYFKDPNITWSKKMPNRKENSNPNQILSASSLLHSKSCDEQTE